MGMNDTPSGERIHIGFFGRRNAGKSSVVNAVTGQALAVVSEVKGTTTDPVSKAMELLPLGPVVIIDTPGFDDEGALGELRVQKTRQILNRTDIAVLVVDAAEGKKECDEQLIGLFKTKELPYLVVYNKSDLLETIPPAGEQEIVFKLSSDGTTVQQKLKVEVKEEYFTDEMAQLVGLQRKLEAELRSVIGLGFKVRLVEPKSIERSTGKAKRVFDNRQL